MFDAVRRAMREARWADHPAITRRDFLKGAGATVALAAAGCRAEDAGRLVIVGAGCAGLTCAYRLQQAGFRPRLIEASTRVGGRMFTHRGLPGGQHAELGGEFIDTQHTELRQLVKETGLSLIDLESAAGTTQPFFFFDGSRVPFEKIVEEFRPIAGLIEKDLETVPETADYRHPSDLDKLSIAQWLDTRGVSGSIRKLLEVAYVIEYGLDTGEQSCLNLLFLIGTEPGSLELYGDSDERYRIAEGSDELPRRLASRLDRPVELGTRLEAIRRLASGTYVLTVDREGKVEDLRAERVVLTIPFTLLRQVDIKVELPPAKRLAIDSLGYGTNSKVLAGFARRVWTDAGCNGDTFTDLPYQSSWETTLGQAGGGGVLTNFLGGSGGVAVGEGSPDERAAEFVGQASSVLPGLGDAYTGKALRYHWPTAPFALGSYACYKPGQYSSIAGAEGERAGGLHFAGEHTSVEFQGYMNGAAESGERAAREVLAGI